ncbi:zinc-binding alcohol dehydrogenase [Eremomyces bilateralis CBS 781.70]|uniref:Zinc-binding alcohol dehydrogenase n=1 Tax=Eremomyces bilateralis CBS 781.70 TaxID=1392243 RepID=A0A6G1GDA1_9PEZI|nr:zinc-binding alcohol dehydrogenase [Eremomyces bilateralis CBS 781.70]KAF1816077.1 zinc-binding alcohol dehydrogenase [Eremomyces bilateralis CBS 781.70]
MKAIVVEEFGGPDRLVMKAVPTPEPKAGFVLIKIRAFGLNHAEMYMRRGDWAEAMPIIGIECVGTVAACPGSEFQLGTAVVSLMGGLGRTINGSYAEYTNASVATVVELGTVDSLPLPWDQLAAIPETYATAWTCLFQNLELRAGQTLLVRGATSALGKAAVKLAVNKGVKVFATTRKAQRHNELIALGVERVEQEGPGLPERLSIACHKPSKFDAVLELIGNSTLLESLTVIRRGGRLCLAGFLGGLEPIVDFNPLLQMASGVHFSFFGSFVYGTLEFPLADVPLLEIFQTVADGKIEEKPVRVFRFEEKEIREAHRAMEGSAANGKMVVLVD